MTKYILNSGGLKNYPEKADKFNKEIVKGLGSVPRVLFCHFAIPQELWEEKFSIYSQRFLESMDKGISPTIELAAPDTFEEQLGNCDVVLMHGGYDDLLLEQLKKYNLPDAWEGKVVVGSSAGSDVLANYFYGCDSRRVEEGLGILPIKFFPHFKSEYGQDDPRGPIDWDSAYTELKNHKEDLPIFALEEGDYIVLEKWWRS